jgi:hypothetical protein
MVGLLIGASWLLVVSLVLGLCAAAREGDLRQDPSRSAAVRAPVRHGCVTITRAHPEHATPDDAQIGTVPTAGRFTVVSWQATRR